MKSIFIILNLVFALSSCANTGSTVGNGLVAKTVNETKIKADQKDQMKKCEKLGGKVITVEKTEYCQLKEGDKKPLSAL